MSLITSKKKRAVGACVQCMRKKRKCDHAEPSCSQCSKHNDICEKRNFKNWSGQKRSLVACGATSHAKTCSDTFAAYSAEAVQLEPAHVQRLEPGSPPLTASLLSVVRSEIQSSTLFNPRSSSVITKEATIEPLLVSFRISPRTNYSPEAADRREVLPSNTANHTIDFQLVTDNERSSVNPNITTTVSDHPAVLVTGSSPEMTGPLSSPLDMVESPLHKFLWRYYMDLSRDRILCFEIEGPTPHTHFQEPLTTLIPRMALFSTPLRAAILHLAATQWNLRNGENALHISSKVFFGEAVQSLVAMGPNTTDVTTLLIVVATAVYLYLSDSRRNHNFLELARSAAAFLAAHTSSNSRSDDFDYQTIMSLLRWADISTLCSFRPPPTQINEETHQLLELRPQELNQNFTLEYGGWISHGIYAFSAGLINPLLRLGWILQHLRSQYPHSEALTPNNKDLEQMTSNLEKDILQATGNFEIAHGAGPADSASLLHLNQAMHGATLLIFYSRVRKLPFTAPLIRLYVQQIVDEVLSIPVNSCVSNAVLFPLGVAGCEAVDSGTRIAIEARLQVHTGIQATHGLISSLRLIWAQRDVDPALLWPTWSEKVDPNYSDILF